MPNHWESSARPLFIKTVFVNGNRHAILFEKDPLLRSGNSPLKKISRPNSSISFASDLSLVTSHSQDSDFEAKRFKNRNITQRQEKQLSSELQNCLVKLKLDSGHLKNKNKFAEEKFFFNSKEVKETQGSDDTNPRQEKFKSKDEKPWQKNYGDQQHQKPNKYKVTGKKSNEGKSCYVYNLEKFKGKKSYCFVKITSQPPQFVLNCSCEKGLNKNHYCDSSVKCNMVISATIHNLIMKSNENENYLENPFSYASPGENWDCHWNDYLARSFHCSSLSERVFQWLELARRRKQKTEKLNSKEDTESLNSTERIFSGKKFVDEIQKRETLRKKDKKPLVNKTVSTTQGATSDEEMGGEVMGEPNVETLLSSENSNNNSEEHSRKINPSAKVYRNSGNESEIVKQESNENPSVTFTSNFSSFLKTPTEETLNTPILNLIKSPLKIQDLLLSSTSEESYSFMKGSEKRVKATCTRQKKEDSALMSINTWRKISGKKKVFTEKSDVFGNQLNSHHDENSDENADKRKEHILTEEFTERNQKSINNLNITRTRPFLIPNLSPQQQQQEHDKKSHFQQEKIIWSAEKKTGKPQLHIFMPAIVLKEQSDDYLSECENFLDM